MSDQYIPPRPGTSAPGSPPGAARDEFSRTNVHIQTPVDRPVRSGGGFGTGMLVAAVFVVVAIFAFVVFGQRDTSGPGPAPAPNVSIENNNVPDAMPAPVPDAAPADPVPVPDTVTPDTVTPDTGTADPVAPVVPAEP